VIMMWVTIWDGEGWVGVLFFCRGAGEDGQLGLGGFDNKDHVCRIEALSQIRVSSIVAGSRNSLAITEDGQLYTWGWNQRATLGHPPAKRTESVPSQVKALAKVKIVQAAIGGWHCLAVDEDGRAYAWGKCHYWTNSLPGRY
jgi:hypothetical protein